MKKKWTYWVLVVLLFVASFIMNVYSFKLMSYLSSLF